MEIDRGIRHSLLDSVACGGEAVDEKGGLVVSLATVYVRETRLGLE